VAHRKLPIIRRRIFTALTVVSLLLCVATLALWVRSYSYEDQVRFHSWSGLSSRGTLVVWWTNMYEGSIYLWTGPLTDGQSLVDLLWAQSTYRPRYRAAWFEAAHNFSGTLPVEQRLAIMPHWFLALLFAILPALHLRALIRSRRLRRIGHCPRCGYDLRATPQRCPECGTRTGTEAPRHVGT
jgi:hypothetical protein